MNTPSDGRSHDRTIDSQQEVAQLCRQFEAEWEKVRQPRWEEFAEQVGPKHRDQLIDKLVSLERENLNRLKERLSKTSSERRQSEEARRMAGGESTIDGPQASFESTIGNKETTDRISPDSDSTKQFIQSSTVRFDNLRPYAQGGLGQVSRAWDCELDREVALKQIKEAYADNSRNRVRFVTEAKVTGQLEHPGIVPVYGFGVDTNGHPYYAMRFIKGDSLRQAIDRFHDDQSSGPFDRMALRSLLGRFVDVCNAVEFAHDQSVIHRDIKPANIMLGDFGETLLVDWGLAKRLEQDSSSAIHAHGNSDATEQVGTPAYMSPEQADGRPGEVGPKSDLYSLGATLYHLLTGQPPFQGQDIHQTLECVRAGEFESPRVVNPRVPKPLEAICTKAMAREANDRYASSRDLADEIEHWLADEPVGAYREPITARLWRWGRRHRTKVASASVIILVSLISLIVVVAVIANANRELNISYGKLAAAKSQLENQNLELARKNEEIAAAERVAAKERDTAVAINDFINYDLLNQANPRRQSNRDVKLRTIVDLAAKRIDYRFDDQPLVEAGIRSTLGRVYRALGELEVAEALLDRAIEIRTEYLGPKHPDTLSSRHNRAMVDEINGAYDVAEEKFSQLRVEMLEELGEEHEHTIATSNALARIYDLQGRQDEAEHLFQRSYDIAMEKWGPRDRVTVTYKNNLAYWHQRRGNYEVAEEMFKQVLEIELEKYGEEHPGTIATLHNLAYVYHRQGRVDEAIPLFERSVELSRRVNGENSLETLTGRMSLSTVYEREGDLQRAEELLRQSLKALEANFGEEHPRTLLCMSQLGELYTDSRRQVQAIPLLEEAVAGQRSVLRPTHPELMRSIQYLGKAYAAEGRNTEAEALLLEVLSYIDSHIGDETKEAQEVLLALGKIYWAQRKTDKSIPLFERYYASTTKTYGPDHNMTVIGRANLALNLHTAGRIEEALTLLNESFEGSRDIKGLYWVPKAIFESNISLGNTTEAIAFIEEILAAEAQRTSAESDEYELLMASYGYRCLELKEYAKSAELFERIVAGRRQAGLDGWLVESTRFMLGIARLGANDVEAADELLTNSFEVMNATLQDAPAIAVDDLFVQLERVASMFEERGYPDKASDWRRKRVALDQLVNGDFEVARPIEGVQPPRPVERD